MEEISNRPESHLDRLLVAEVETPWYAAFFQNLKDALFPEKLPPLEVTSKPIPVEEIFGKKATRAPAGLTSLLIHAGIVLLIITVGSNKAVQKVVKEKILLLPPDIAPYVATQAPKKQAMGGGGGGGDRSPLPASKGRLPRFAPEQFTPPMAVVNNPNPKLIMEPTLDIQPNAPVPNVNMSQFGDPLAKVGPPSNGPGSGGGIGSGSNGGVGSGSGTGYGPGRGGNFGGGVYRIGGDVSQPVALYRPDPEYSEEARKAKYQGTVLLAIIIDENGKARDIRVVRALGLGLDEKAIEAVQKWRFRPATKQGHPVAVQAQIEVNFRLL
jgi:periplasmic protein TonB